MADNANPGGMKGNISDVIEDADVFIGPFGPGIVTSETLKKVARRISRTYMEINLD